MQERARVDGILQHIQPIGARALGIRNDANIARSLSRFNLEKIAVPTLVLSVRDDLYGTYASAQYTAGRIPGARFVGYDRGGHLWVGHHNEVIAEILSFLALQADLSVDRLRGPQAPISSSLSSVSF